MTTSLKHIPIADLYGNQDQHPPPYPIRVQIEAEQRPAGQVSHEVERLNGQLQMLKTSIEGKDQILDLLKGGFNRQN